jgi:DNA-binding NtrC family response regulator
LTPAVQGKVLRVLEERSFERVGGSQTVLTDARLVAATNRDLEAMVAAGSFRSDLFYRLDVFPIELPPLRDRPSDVPLLARHLLASLAEVHGRPPVQLDDEAASLLTELDWPGNVRQLANLLERAIILGEGQRLTAAELRPLLSPGGGDVERRRVRRALEAADGDKRQAAELLGMSYRTLLRRVAEFDLAGYPRYRD